MTHFSEGFVSDADIVAIYIAMEAYSSHHPLAEVGVFRRGEDRVSVRVIDPDFEGMRLKERNDHIWQVLESRLGSGMERISVLLLMTPQEANERQVISVEFDESSSGPVPFRNGESVFRNEILGHQVYVSVGKPLLKELNQSMEYCVAIKFDFRPGILAVDDGQLSVDIGETLRDEHHQVRWFNSIEQARDAALEIARQQLSRFATV